MIIIIRKKAVIEVAEIIIGLRSKWKTVPSKYYGLGRSNRKSLLRKKDRDFIISWGSATNDCGIGMLCFRYKFMIKIHECIHGINALSKNK